MFRNRQNRSVVGTAVRPVIEGLEGRRMMSASLTHGGELLVHGTAHADDITISMDAQNENLFEVSVNGKVKTFHAAAVKHIVVNTGGGNDSATVDSSVTAPATLLGGSGNDTLVAGGGSDVLIGGTGNDLLEGGAGNDTLTCGAGNDTLLGGTGNAVMNGGAGYDLLQGGAGNCTLQGGTGVDTIVNGTGDDSVAGGNSDDIIKPNPYATDGGDAQPQYVTGTIVSVDSTADTLTLSSSGVTTTYMFTSATAVYLNGTVNTLSSLTPGAAACLKLTSDGTTVMAAGVETPGNTGGGSHDATPTPTPTPTQTQYAGGTVVSVDTTADTVTVANAGVNATYDLTSQSIIYINHAASPLSAITAGEKLSIELAADGKTVVVMGTSTNSDPVPTPTPTPSPTPTPTQYQYAGGTIVSVDPTADTVTIANSAGVDSTYNVTSQSIIYINHAVSPLSALVAGEKLSIELAADGTTVVVMGTSTNSDPVPTPTPTPSPTPTPTQYQYAGGTIVSVDPTADTVTIANSAGVDSTYNVTSQSIIYINHAVSPLSALVAGEKLSIELAADGTTVVVMGTSTQA